MNQILTGIMESLTQGIIRLCEIITLRIPQMKYICITTIYIEIRSPHITYLKRSHNVKCSHNTACMHAKIKKWAAMDVKYNYSLMEKTIRYRI